MLTRKRKLDNSYYNDKIPFFLDEIKKRLNNKNIFLKEEFINEGLNKNINIYLIDKNNNTIGTLNGGIGEFYILENDESIETNAFSINWIKVEKEYQGYNLGTFLIIYSIYLCKNKYNDIEYIVVDDDTDQTDPTKNIYVKLGFIYKETKEEKMNDGQIIKVPTGPEMQIKISDFFNQSLNDKLNKIMDTIQNLNKNIIGGKTIKKRKRKMTKKKKGKKNKKTLKKYLCLF